MNLESLRKQIANLIIDYCHEQAIKQEKTILDSPIMNDEKKETTLSQLKIKRDHFFNSEAEDQRHLLADAINALNSVYNHREQHLLLMFELIKKTDHTLEFIFDVNSDLEERNELFKELHADLHRFITTLDKLMESGQERALQLDCWNSETQSKEKRKFELTSLKLRGTAERAASKFTGVTLSCFGLLIAERLPTIKTSYDSPANTLEWAADKKRIHELEQTLEQKRRIITEFQRQGVEYWFDKYYQPSEADIRAYLDRQIALKTPALPAVNNTHHFNFHKQEAEPKDSSAFADVGHSALP